MEIMDTGHASKRGMFAFTVAEVMLVIALIAVMGALTVVNYPRLAAGRGSIPAREVLIRAVRAAHHEARVNKRPQTLIFDREAQALVVADGSGSRQQYFPLPGEGWEMVFYRILPEERLDGAPVYALEEYPATRIHFHPAGNGPTFQAEMTRDTLDIRMVFDPFSGNPLPVEPQT